MKTKNLFLIAIGALIFCSLFGFGSQPNIVLFKISEYNFGINYSDYFMLKLLSLGLLFIYGINMNSKIDKENISKE